MCEPTFSSWRFWGALRAPQRGPGHSPRGKRILAIKWLKTGLWVAVYMSKSWCTKQLVFVRSYITKRKIGHSFRGIGLPFQRGTNTVRITPPAQRLPGNCLQCANVSFPTQTNNITFKSKYQTKVHKHSTLFSI